MDTGFLDKFESYYGRRATKTLLGFLALCAVLLGIGGVWSALSPIYVWAQSSVTLSGFEIFYRSLLFVCSVSMLISMCVAFAQTVSNRARIKEGEQRLEEFYEQLGQVADWLEKAAVIHDETLGIHRDAQAVFPAGNERENIDHSISSLEQSVGAMREFASSLREMIHSRRFPKLK